MGAPLRSSIELTHDTLKSPLSGGLVRRCDRLRVCYERYAVARQAQLASGERKVSRREDETPGDFDPDEKLKTVHRLVAELDAIAKLASVDGAVVLRKDSLAVVGFGSMCTARKDPVTILQASPSGKGLACVQLSSLGGARHQSAARWCQEYGAAGFAIVVSQDGAGSFIRRVGEMVLAIRPLQLGSEDQGVVGD